MPKVITRTFLTISCFICGVVYLFSQENVLPPKPEPAVYINDFSGWLSSPQKMELEQELKAFHDTTSNQIVVMIRSNIGDYDRASYATALGEAWDIGYKGKDNGIVCLIVTDGNQRGVFISTGYGLEGVMPDVLASRIARNIMIPYFKQGQYFEGVKKGVIAIKAAINGEFSAEKQSSNFLAPLLLIFVLFVGLMIFVFLISKRMGRFHSGYKSYDDFPDDDDDYNQSQRGLGRSRGPVFWDLGSGSGNSSSSGGGWSGGSFGGGSFGGGGGGGSW